MSTKPSPKDRCGCSKKLNNAIEVPLTAIIPLSVIGSEGRKLTNVHVGVVVTFNVVGS